MFLKCIFILLSALLISVIGTGSYIIFSGKNRNYLSQCGVIATILFLCYTICGIVFLFVSSSIIFRFLILLCTLSPYIIGKFAKYETFFPYTNLQISILALGILLVVY